MKLSDINSIFVGQSSFGELKTSLSKEMKEYNSSSLERGKSMPVYLTDDINLTIGENELGILCKAYLDEELDESEINYIADALLLSNNVTFKDENISDRLGYLTDPEINGRLTKDIVRKIMMR